MLIWGDSWNDYAEVLFNPKSACCNDVDTFSVESLLKIKIVYTITFRLWIIKFGEFPVHCTYVRNLWHSERFYQLSNGQGMSL